MKPRCIEIILLASILLFLPSSSLSKRIRKDGEPTARAFQVRNLSKSSLDVYWVNLASEDRVHQFTLAPGGTDRLNTHVLHEFEVRELPNNDGQCKGKNGSCRNRFFQISEEEDQIFTINADFNIEETNSRTRAKEKARSALEQCNDKTTDSMDPSEQIDRISQCMEERIHASIYESQEEIDFQADIRRRMGEQLVNYACEDPQHRTTDPIREVEWNPKNKRLLMDDLNHTLKVLMEADTDMVAVIESLITPSDCEVLQQLAHFNLDDPSLVLWDFRKEPPVLDFLTRMYAYSGPAAKLMNLYAGLPEKGEPLFKIYQDSSKEPHGRKEHQIGEWPVKGPLFANLFMFCEVPDEDNGGGGIHFPESGVHVRPQVGDALFISYTKPSDGQGLNEKFSNKHIECPVLSGERIIVQHQFQLFPNDVASKTN